MCLRLAEGGGKMGVEISGDPGEGEKLGRRRQAYPTYLPYSWPIFQRHSLSGTVKQVGALFRTAPEQSRVG